MTATQPAPATRLDSLPGATFPIARLALVAAAVSSATWLLPAAVHIVDWPATGPVRVAFLAPLSRLWLAIGSVAAVMAGASLLWLKSGRTLDDLARTLLPLSWLLLWCIPFLPWLADRAPLLLVFAGPLRWAVAAVAMAAVVAGCLPAGFFVTAKRLALGPLIPGRLTVFIISVALYSALGLQYAREMGFGGDEPHYLIITHSLLADRDLDIANNHAQRDYRPFFAGELRPDFLQRGIHGEIYSIHAPGLPALLVPAYAIAGALGAVVFVAFLAALTGVAIFELATMLAGPSVATVVWAATCLTVPFVPHAWLIYPELPGALIVAWAVLWLRQAPASIGRTFLHGAALAVLPWLHTKFAVFVLLFTLYEAIRLWPRLKHIAALVLPIGLSGIAWLYSFYRMYGVLDPEAPYGSYTRMFVLASNIPRGALGLLFDQKFGLLAYSPVYVLVLAGAWIMLSDPKQRAFAAALLVAAVAFFASTTRLYMWWGGSSAPARFLVPIVPLLAPMIALAVARLRGIAGRAVVVSTLVVSFAVAIVTIGSDGEELLYSDPHGVAALATFVQGSAPLDRALPTFTEENWHAPVAVLTPWLLGLGVVGLVLAVCARRRVVRSVFWTATSASVGYFFVVSVISPMAGSTLMPGRDRSAAGGSAPGRAEAVLRGRLALMRDYDPSRLRAVDVTHIKRMNDPGVLAAATLTIRRAPDAPVDNPHVLEGPFELPEGRYDARIWFEGASPTDAEAFVALSDQVLIARAAPPLANPVTLSFELPLRTPAFVGLSSAVAARSARRVDITPAFIQPRSARDPQSSHVVEPVGGSAPGYMAYADNFTYPEGGVFWTRDTEKGTVIVATGGASTLRLILHVGPTGGPVTLEIAGRRTDLELKPNETREVSLPVPAGTRRMVVSVKAARSFRPAEVDSHSDDQRRLGCQVRPMLF